MAYAFIQQNANDNAASAATITVTLTPTAGNLLVFAISGDSLDTSSIALSDNLGTHNTFTQISTDLVSLADQRCAWWFAANCKGGATTFTATFSTSTRFRTIYVAEYSGIATTSPFLNGTRAENQVPGTGADAVSSGNANATSQPALVWGFSIDVTGGTTPAAGTGYTSRAGVWSTATALGRPEDKRVTVTGNVAATFTATTGTDTHATGIGIFAEVAATPTVASWSPNFPDRFQARPSVSAFGVAVAPVMAIALTPLCWLPSFPDRVSARPVPNLAAGSVTEPVFVPPAAPSVTPMSWSPAYPDQLRRVGAAAIVGGSSAPEATLPNPIPSPASWLPAYPDVIHRPRAPLVAGGVVAPVVPNLVPAPASWWPTYPDSISRARAPQVMSSAVAPTLPIPNAPPSIFPLAVSANGRHLQKNDGMPFLLFADTTWSLFEDIPLASIGTYFGTLVTQGFNAVSSNAIEHHYTMVKPPKERGGLLPFTQKMDGTSFTGSPNGTTGAAGTQGQFTSDNYSNINNQAPDCTFINNNYWTAVETILNAALASNLAVLIWPGYLGFHANDEGWLNEMVVWDAVTGAGGFTGFSFADPSKSKMWNYGAWMAARWKNYPNLIWVLGGDYGSNTQTLNTAQAAAVSNLMAGLKSVAGQQSLLFTAHWDRPALSTDTSLAAGTFDLNGCYADEAVAELARRGFASSPAKPTIGLEYYYELDLFGGSAPFRKYVYWQFLGGIAGGFYGHEQLWRFDNGSPGTDWTTLLATQARLDAVRQVALWRTLPWHRLKPSGLGGVGTLVTAGGGSASPQGTDYVAAAATPEGDLLLAYVPPDHTGSVTIDMSKLGASVTARWFDPANAAFTSIGAFANTGTHAFTTPGTNSAGDPDWLLVLTAPDAPMPLSWDPTFPDRAPRLSLTTAQVVSGVVQPVVPPPTPTLANWSPDFPDFAPRVRQPVNVGGTTRPETTLPDAPAFSWSPSFPDRLPATSARQPGGSTAPPTDTNAGPLTWSPSFPDRVAARRLAIESGPAAPIGDVTAALLSWQPAAGSAVVAARARGVVLSETVEPVMVPATSLASWAPVYPDAAARRRLGVVGGTTAPEATLPNASAALFLAWASIFPDCAPRARQAVNQGGAFAPDTSRLDPVPLSWAPVFSDVVRTVRRSIGGSQDPQVTSPLPDLVVPSSSWAPGFPDALARARGALLVSGQVAPVTTIPDPPPLVTAWSPTYPSQLARARGALIMGGDVAPEAVLPNPPAPALSWAPTFPDSAPRARGVISVGGASVPEAVLPNPPAPISVRGVPAAGRGVAGVTRGSVVRTASVSRTGGVRVALPSPAGEWSPQWQDNVVDFDRDAFTRFIEDKGYAVSWEKAVLCPNVPGTGLSPRDHAIGCPICDERGFIYVDPTPTKMLMQGIRLNQSFFAYGRWDVGNMLVTAEPEFTVDYFDRLTLGNGVGRFTQRLVRQPGLVADKLKYAPLCFHFVGWVDRAGALVQFSQDADFRVSADGASIEWPDANQPDAGSFYSVCYDYRPRYVVLDLVHHHRDSTVEGQHYQFPVQAVAKLDFMIRNEGEDPRQVIDKNPFR